MPKYSWSFPCSPRNPGKIKPELELLGHFIPKWRSKGIRWGPSFGSQDEFGQALRKMEEGEFKFQLQRNQLTSNNLRWTARARFGTYKFFGFVYIDEYGFCDLTEAGRRLILTSRPDEVMLKQFLKWQYPDPQHNRKEFLEDIFYLFPFVAVTKLINDLEGLSKTELALFVFTLIRMDQIKHKKEEIQRFREIYGRTIGRVPKRRLISKTLESLRMNYQNEGFKIPVKSFHDYADALIRYFRYTKLFSVRGVRLIISVDRTNEIDDILNMDFELRPYHDRQSFYIYYGNPDIPLLPFENLLSLQSEVQGLRQTLRHLDRKYFQLVKDESFRFPRRDEVLPSRIEEIKELLAQLRYEKQKLERAIFEHEAQRPEVLKEILDYFSKILSRDVVDPPTYLEWNTWRSFVSIDKANKIKENFILDIDLQPLDHAPGGKADMEIYFEDFVIVPEVTLKTGSTQWRDEAMPVPRHVLNIQKKEKRKVIGLFIAPKIHEDTMRQFHICMLHAALGENVVVIPITIEQFIDILNVYCKESKNFNPLELKDLLYRIESAGNYVSQGEEWIKKIPNIISEWKQMIDNPES